MRWLIDGMNVIGTRPDGWWRDRDAAMLRLVDRIERWAANDVRQGLDRIGPVMTVALDGGEEDFRSRAARAIA